MNNIRDSPSLSIIESKIKSNKYESISEFTLDLRNLWTFYFQNYSTNPDPDLYQKVLKMSQLSEEIGKELQNNEENNINICAKDINKTNANIRKDLKEIKGAYRYSNQKKGDHLTHLMDKPLTTQEKNLLSNNIRSLNNEQLMGIVKILGNTKEVETNRSHLEFDLEKLPVKLLRELEKYTNNSLKNHPSKQKANEDAQKGKANQIQRKEIICNQNQLYGNQFQGTSVSVKKQPNGVNPNQGNLEVNNTQQELIKATSLITTQPKSVLDASFDMESISSDSSSSINSDLSSD